MIRNFFMVQHLVGYKGEHANLRNIGKAVNLLYAGSLKIPQPFHHLFPVTTADGDLLTADGNDFTGK
jgi:hypothetical protein